MMDPDDLIPDDIPEMGDEPREDEEPEGEDDEPREDQFNSDVEADANALASAGLGTDEDYGLYSGGEDG